MQPLFGTNAAEGAFERTDHRFERFRRKIFVTAFATRFQCEHGRLYFAAIASTSSKKFGFTSAGTISNIDAGRASPRNFVRTFT